MAPNINKRMSRWRHANFILCAYNIFNYDTGLIEINVYIMRKKRLNLVSHLC